MLTKRKLIRYYHFLNIYIVYWNRAFTLMKFLFFNFSIIKLYDFFIHFYIWLYLFLMYIFLFITLHVFSFKSAFYKKIFFKLSFWSRFIASKFILTNDFSKYSDISFNIFFIKRVTKVITFLKHNASFL